MPISPEWSSCGPLAKHDIPCTSCKQHGIFQCRVSQSPATLSVQPRGQLRQYTRVSCIVTTWQSERVVTRCLHVQAMGDKTTARRLAEECGVPTVPGSKDPITDAQSAMKFSKSAGYPVILKAAMGGGGRGMRVVHQGKTTAKCAHLQLCIAIGVRKGIHASIADQPCATHFVARCLAPCRILHAVCMLLSLNAHAAALAALFTTHRLCWLFPLCGNAVPHN